LENLVDGATGRRFDFGICVGEGNAQSGGETAADRAFPRAHHADQNHGFLQATHAAGIHRPPNARQICGFRALFRGLARGLATWGPFPPQSARSMLAVLTSLRTNHMRTRVLLSVMVALAGAPALAQDDSRGDSSAATEPAPQMLQYP